MTSAMMQEADALHLAGRLDEAVLAYRAALRLDPGSADGWYAVGCAHLRLQASGSAAAALARAVALAPQAGAAHYALGQALFNLGRVECAVASFECAAAAQPSLHLQALESIACIVPGSSAADAAAVLRARRRWVDACSRSPALARHASPAADGKLRVGYLSAFFGAANWMKPVFALINRHDRTRFEIHLLSDGEVPSAESGYRDHDCDVIHDLRGIGSDEAGAIIGGLGLDVLVDLNGYSFPARLPLLMRRPAPCIVGWFNMFATTGMTAFDWLVGDEAVLPPGEEADYCERIHRLPGSYLAFEVSYPVPDVSPPPCLERGWITFGCFGSHYKLTDAVLQAWGRILAAAPTARLHLKNAGLSDASVREDVGRRLGRLGVDPSRLTLDGGSPHAEFLDAYRDMDVALDTFPYNGGTTTTEALWQGVPVLAFDGDRWAARTSKSLLLAAGLDQWLAADVDGYIDRAVALASDPATPARLTALRATLRDQLRRSRACDADGLRRAVEAFYAQITPGDRAASRQSILRSTGSPFG